MQIYLNGEALDLLMPLCRKRNLNPRELVNELIKSESESVRDNNNEQRNLN